MRVLMTSHGYPPVGAYEALYRQMLSSAELSAPGQERALRPPQA
jgi:hypothetical protein